MPEFTVHLIGGEGDEIATVTTETRNRICHISFRYRDRLLEAEASDYFKAFCDIRLQLEPEGLIPFCYGASLNVYPSGIARDMGAGMVAYRFTQGFHARMADLARIFDSGPDIIPASVAMQREFFERWLKSPREQHPTSDQATSP
jgi:hypothetical protein